MFLHLKREEPVVQAPFFEKHCVAAEPRVGGICPLYLLPPDVRLFIFYRFLFSFFFLSAYFFNN